MTTFGWPEVLVVQQVNNMQVAALHHMLDKDNLSYSTVLLICFARGGEFIKNRGHHDTSSSNFGR